MGFRKHSGRSVDSGVVKLSGRMKSDEEYSCGDEVFIVTRAVISDEKYGEDSHGSFQKTMFAKGKTLVVAPDSLHGELASLLAAAEVVEPEADGD